MLHAHDHVKTKQDPKLFRNNTFYLDLDSHSTTCLAHVRCLYEGYRCRTLLYWTVKSVLLQLRPIKTSIVIILPPADVLSDCMTYYHTLDFLRFIANCIRLLNRRIVYCPGVSSIAPNNDRLL